MSINKHGLKMEGLKKASGNLYSSYSGGTYDELFYDRSDGKVWTVFQCSLGQNSYTVYHSDSIIKIGNCTEHYTMQEIADWIAEVVAECDD